MNIRARSLLAHLSWWFPLLIGGVLTLLVARGFEAHNSFVVRQQTAQAADRAQMLIRERFGLFEYGLRGTRGAVITAGPEGLSRDRFIAYIDSREQSREFPGALGLGFIRRVPAAEEAEFLARARADGFPNFQIKALQPHEGDRFVIQYIYPLVANERATGLDIASEANRRDAANAAARTGQPRLTAPITLVQADGKPRRGFLILLPAYRANASLATPESREAATWGWAYAPLVVDDVLQDLGGLKTQARITLASANEAEPFYQSGSLGDRGHTEVTVTRDMTVMGQPWRLTLSLYPDAIKKLPLWSVWWAVATGIAFTCLMLSFNHLLQTRTTTVFHGNEPLPSGAAKARAFVGSALFLRSFPPIVLAVFMAAGFAIWSIADAQRTRLSDILVPHAEAVVKTLQGLEADYREHALFLASTPPVSGIMRTQATGSDPKDRSSLGQWNDRLADIFEAFMRANPDVYQVRFIAATPEWRERVSLRREGDRLVRIAGTLLESKASEPDIQGSLDVGPGKVYASEIDLGREYGVVKRPLKYLWRFATPVLRPDGSVFGIVIISLDLSSALRPLVDRTPTDVSLFLNNQRGEFVIHPQRDRVFDIDSGQPLRWSDAFSPQQTTWFMEAVGLGSWVGELGEAWVRQVRFTPQDAGNTAYLTVSTAAYKWPVYLLSALQTGVATLALAILGCLTIAMQYASWVSVERQRRDSLRQEAEARGARQTQLFKGLLDSAPDPVIVVDQAGTIQSLNDQAIRLFHYEREEMEGRPLYGLVPESQRAALHQLISAYSEWPSNKTIERGQLLHALRKDGAEVAVEVSLSSVRIEDRLLVSVSVRDVTVRIEKEQQLREALERAEQATAAKSAFLANTSHEIRTPLNAIIGLTHLLSEEKLTDAQLQLVNKVQVSGRSLLGIVNDVLDLSKIEADEMSIEELAFELPELLEEVGSIFQPQAENKGLAFHLETDHGVPGWVVSDSTKLRQMLLNLLSNALKFTSTGYIRMSAQPSPQPPERDAGRVWLRLMVEDTGIGISAETQSRLFKPFSQADASTTRRFGGTGLGLSIVRRLAELLGGTAGVESREGVGSRFWVDLPVRIPGPDEVLQRDGQAGGLFVMIAEDDPQDAQRLQQMTRSLGWRSQIVHDGDELVEAFMARQRSGARPPDTLLVDWQMPRTDGVTALYQLAEKVGPDRLPAVLVISAQERERIESLDKDHLVSRVLHKPVSSSELFNAVNEVVTQHTGNTKRVLQATRTEAVRAHWLPRVRVLVVDDSSLNLEVVSRILQRNGAQVQAVDNAASALACLRERADEFDAVLMDVQMPRMDGLEATSCIREELGLKDLPVIALTAGALVEEKRRAIDAGMNDFLTKPIDPSQLINRVRAAVEAYRGIELPIEEIAEEEVKTTNWPAVPGLDEETARKLLMNDRELFMTTLEQLLREHAGLAEQPDAEIDNPASSAMRQQLAARVHKLRSASGSVGASQMYALASKAENALRAADQPVREILSALARLMVDLQKNSTPVLEAWRKEQKQKLAATDDSDSLTVLTPETRQALMDLLRDNDLSVLEQVERSGPALKAAMGDDRYSRFAASVRQLDFEVAIDLLQTLDASTPSTT